MRDNGGGEAAVVHGALSEARGFAGAQAADLVDYLGKTCTTVSPTGVMWQSIIHGLFILSAIGIAYTDKVMTGSAGKREQLAH